MSMVFIVPKFPEDLPEVEASMANFDVTNIVWKWPQSVEVLLPRSYLRKLGIFHS
jgi:hypothetical protein